MTYRSPPRRQDNTALWLMLLCALAISVDGWLPEPEPVRPLPRLELCAPPATSPEWSHAGVCPSTPRR